MGRAFEYRKATKLKRWGHMAKTFTRLGKQIAIAVKADAILTMSVDCMREQLLAGQKIQLGDLGSFYISINSTGAASAQEFNPAIHIRRLNVNWTCGQRFGELLEEAEFNLVATRSAARAVVKALKAGKTTVDLTGATGGGEDAGGGSNPGGGSDGDQGENPLG